MWINEADMVSATDVSRNSGRYLTQAAGGRRFIVMNNHQPVAGIVGMEDIRRLDQLDNPDTPATAEPSFAANSVDSPIPPSVLRELPTVAGSATLGRGSGGQPLAIEVARHTLIAGAASSDLDTTLSAALAAAIPRDGVDLEFVLLTDDLVEPRREHTPPGDAAPILMIQCDASTSLGFAEQILDRQIRWRRSVLRSQRAGDIDEYRRGGTGPALSDLVVIVRTGSGTGPAGDLVKQLLSEGVRLGIYLWLVVDRASMMADRFGQRIVHRVPSMADSRFLTGSIPTATKLNDGTAYLVDPSTGEDPELLRLAAPDIPADTRQRLEATPGGAEKLDGLPAVVAAADLHAGNLGHQPPAEPLSIPLGVSEYSLQIACAEMATEPHLLIIGGPKSGKSQAISTFCDSVTRRFGGSEDAAIVLIDPRRSHLGRVDSKNLFAHIHRIDDIHPTMTELYERFNLGSRRVPPDIDAEDFAARSWWSGPEIFIVVDDYHLAADVRSLGTDQPLYQMAPWLGDEPLARGFHFVLASSSSDLLLATSRDPLIKRLTQDRAPTLMLSADRLDGSIGEHKFERFEFPGRANYCLDRGSPTRIQLATTAGPTTVIGPRAGAAAQSR